SQQAMLDSFYDNLSIDGEWQRGISDRGFAQARDKLSWTCLEHLNTFVCCQNGRYAGFDTAMAWSAVGGR
ncbi:MAG: hypothetical protein KA781_09865, partial [Aquabacterium sp.]|nr:hypothetical protein [Aquabacterium sp.]